MPAPADSPVAVRATAFTGESTWLRRPVRRVRYDACWADGRVQFDVRLTVMYRGPADFEPFRDSVHAHCPEIGTGRWVNDFPQVLDGPAQLDPNPPGPRGGRPLEFGSVRPRPHPEEPRVWRLGAGVAGVSCGILLFTGPSTDGILGPIAVLCSLTGVATLAGLVPKNRRWW